jgi:uncharacterized protein (TIGR02145 family)
LCHASEDKAAVMQLYERLELGGLHPWVDKEDIPPASVWDREIVQTIQTARLVVICFSRQLISKGGYVQRELDIALQVAQRKPAGAIFLIAVRLDDGDVPAAYSHLRRVDLFEDSGVDTLMELIKATLGLFTDPRDRQIYRTVLIGDQTWLAENLNHEIAGSWWYGNDSRNARPYGRLYTWDAAQNACPPGWHLPDDPEWQQLARNVGERWDGSGSGLYDVLVIGGGSGFDAILGGLYDARGSIEGFYEQMQNGYYWGGSLDTGSFMFAFSGKSGKRAFRFECTDRENGLSCRYVKNAA